MFSLRVACRRRCSRRSLPERPSLGGGADSVLQTSLLTVVEMRDDQERHTSAQRARSATPRKENQCVLQSTGIHRFAAAGAGSASRAVRSALIQRPMVALMLRQP